MIKGEPSLQFPRKFHFNGVGLVAPRKFDFNGVLEFLWVVGLFFCRMSGQQAMSDAQPITRAEREYNELIDKVTAEFAKLEAHSDPEVKKIAEVLHQDVTKLDKGLMHHANERGAETKRVKQEAQHAEIWAEKAAQNVAEVFQVLEVENKKLSERAVDADVFSAKRAIKALFNPDINHEVLTKPPATPETWEKTNRAATSTLFARSKRTFLKSTARANGYRPASLSHGDPDRNALTAWN